MVPSVRSLEAMASIVGCCVHARHGMQRVAEQKGGRAMRFDPSPKQADPTSS